MHSATSVDPRRGQAGHSFETRARRPETEHVVLQAGERALPNVSKGVVLGRSR
jgi:hypothetical protein